MPAARPFPEAEPRRPSRPDPWKDVVVVPENRSAVKAVKRFARILSKPGPAVSPFGLLLLHGPAGVGKTYLAAALVRGAIAAEEVRTALAIPAADLGRPEADAMPPADLDLLVIEDFHRLSAKAADAAGKLLDARAARRRLTVLTSLSGPAGLTALPRRLTSRLTAGLVIHLEPFSLRSRRALVARLASNRGVNLKAEAVAWVAGETTGGGIRPALGMIERLKTMGKGKRSPLGRETAESHLREQDEHSSPLDRILAVVCDAYQVKPKDVRGKSRLRSIVTARQVAMALARDPAKLPLKTIGAYFGGRDHSTVLHSCRTVADGMKADSALAKAVRELRRKVR
ncbi:MAG TPA: helix-turn-helix domain-containing protein [Fimbriiglobus sp.]|jgi:chromosomal replication initiator protein